MLKRVLSIILALILALYLIILILTLENYQMRSVGLGFEYAHSEACVMNVESRGNYDYGELPNTSVITFEDITYIDGERDYYIKFTVPVSLVKESIDLDSQIYVKKAYLSHLTTNVEGVQRGYQEPFIPIYNLLGTFDYTNNGDNTNPKITFYCTNFEVVLNSDTLLGVVGNNLAITSRDFEFGDIENVVDLLEWFNNFIRSIYNFTQNIKNDFIGGF